MRMVFSDSKNQSGERLRMLYELGVRDFLRPYVEVRYRSNGAPFLKVMLVSDLQKMKGLAP